MSRNKQFAIAVVVALVSNVAFAAGFEKSMLWSGRYTGIGNAAVSVVNDSEALYFNPAGLAGASGNQLSVNFSPTFDGQRAPVIPNSGLSDGKTNFLPIFGVTASHALSDKWGVAAGLFVDGGSSADFDSLDFSSLGFPTLKPSAKAAISITEFAIGTGYEILPGLKAGVSWGVMMVKSELDTPAVVGSNLASISYTDLSDTRWNAFRAGLQWASSDNRFGLGATYRSTVDFLVKGNASEQVQAFGSSTITTAATGSAELGNSFPQQVKFGGFYGISSNLRALAEYDWTQYSRDQQIAITGAVPITIQQNWRNMKNVRFGLEHTSVAGGVGRIGYVYTSEVTPPELAAPTFSTPGPGHTAVIGYGRAISSTLEANGALEYSLVKGTGQTSGTSNEYSSHAYALHAGVNYRF